MEPKELKIWGNSTRLISRNRLPLALSRRPITVALLLFKLELQELSLQRSNSRQQRLRKSSLKGMFSLCLRKDSGSHWLLRRWTGLRSSIQKWHDSGRILSLWSNFRPLSSLRTHLFTSRGTRLQRDWWALFGNLTNLGYSMTLLTLTSLEFPTT